MNIWLRGIAWFSLALAASGAGLLLRLALTNMVGPGLPTYVTFYPPVMLVALVAGFWPGLLTTLLSALIVDYWLLPPVGNLFIYLTPLENVGLLLFTAMGVLMSWVAGLYRKSRDRLEKLVVELRSASLYSRSLIEASLDPLVTISPDGRITDVNAATEQATGRLRGELVGTDFSDYFTEADKARDGYRAVLREGLVRDYLLSIQHVSGSTLDVLYNATVYRNQAGEVQGIFAAARDITEHKRAEEEQGKRIIEQAARVEAEKSRAQFAFLAEASKRLSASLVLETTLGNVARIAVPQLADWCAIDIVKEDGSIVALDIAHVNPEKVSWAWELRRRYPIKPDDTVGAARIIRTGRAEMIPEITPAMLESLAKNDEERKIVQSIGYSSIIIVPIPGRDTTLGAITLVSAESGRRYDDSDFVLAQELAMRAGTAIENAQLHRAVEKELSQRKRSEEELRLATQELSRSNKELEQFAYIASHDLQEPLRMVIGFMQLLEKRYRGQIDESADKYIAYAVDGASRMKDLITDLLSYSRINSQAKPFEEVNSGAILEQVLLTIRLSIEKSGAAISHDEMPRIVADPMQISQVFQNLIGNALKFHGEKPPRVHVGAKRQQGEWLFSVRDNGIGIEPQYLEQIFIIFKRLHGRDEYPGTGIGLAICKKVVERHGGRIWVESQPGEGSTFYFTIPEKGVTA